jgi:hypothetical protein
MNDFARGVILGWCACLGLCSLACCCWLYLEARRLRRRTQDYSRYFRKDVQ